KSVNTFFVNLEKDIGICGPWKMANKLGIKLPKKYASFPSFTLGVADVSPLDMAQAYATFAARGVHCSARPVTQIEDARGNVLKKYDKNCRQVMPSPVADAVSDVLRGVMEPGGFGGALSPGQPSAGKTGTTNGNLSVWFAGYTPNLAGASTVFGVKPNGNQDTLDGKSIGGYVRGSTSGSTTAGPIWGNTFKAVAQWLPDKDFVKPSGTDIKGLLVSIPSVGGKGFDDAKSELEGLGFKVVRGSEVDSGYDRGLVAYSYPGSGAQLASGDTVTLYISDGTPKVVKKPKKNKKNKKKNRGGNGNRGGGGNRDD
ncbi:MAG: PASTA domain-containing protein, partial [Nocardioidaceae bacterium]|nr:PASTA domain-containing protein [Nocardioidaceae bacterium]